MPLNPLLPAQMNPKLQGRWALYATDGTRECYDLEITPATDGRAGLVANLLVWTPGAQGCDTCSSDVLSVQLRGATAPGADVALTGDLALTKGSTVPVTLSVKLASDTHGAGSFRDARSPREVTLVPTEVEPLFQPAAAAS